jgi:hypothetical protein
MRADRLKRFVRSAPCLLTFLLPGCNSGPAYLEHHPLSALGAKVPDRISESQPGPPAGTELPDVGVINRRIARIKPCPVISDREDYGEDAWSYLIGLAHDLQRVHPIALEDAFQDYCIHYRTAFEEGTDMDAEWSKVLLLLRVMFVLPGNEDASVYARKGWPGHGFTFGRRDTYAGVPVTLATPIDWTKGRPRIYAGRAGYFGGPYEGDAEYRYFLEHFEYRNLEALLARPTTEEGRAPGNLREEKEEEDEDEMGQ